jgi:hypothetical protein
VPIDTTGAVGGIARVVTVIVADCDSDGLTALTTRVYVVDGPRSLNVADLAETPLSTDGVSGIPFNVYV